MLRRTAILTGSFAATLVFSGGVASAAPLAVQQSPAVGTGISGLLVPMKVASRVAASSTGDVNTVRLSAPNGQAECATTFSKALIRIDWRNTQTGRVGSVTIKGCPVGYNPEVPTSAVVNTGPGRVTFVQTIRGSRESWSAGLPAIPGAGSINR